MSPSRGLAAGVAAALLGGCEMASVYFNETAGISPLKLLPLYFQEKEYVEDRELEARVRGALAAQGLSEVTLDVYLKEVTLAGAPARAAAVAGAVRGVKAVRLE